MKLIIDVLRGSRAEKVLKFKLDLQAAYGTLGDVKESRIREMINYLILEGYLEISGDQYPVLRLGASTGEVLEKEKRLSMKLVREQDEKEKGRKRPSAESSNIENLALFEKLRSLRTQIAAAQRVPAYVVFTNAALEDMCSKMPATLEDFALVSGVGQNKLARYGKQFLAAINND